MFFSIKQLSISANEALFAALVCTNASSMYVLEQAIELELDSEYSAAIYGNRLVITKRVCNLEQAIYIIRVPDMDYSNPFYITLNVPSEVCYKYRKAGVK